MRLTVTGAWPGELTLRSSWAKAKARPWNDELPYGYVRLLRGNAGFLRNAGRHVLELGTELVASPPLAAGNDEPWRAAGFTPFLTLHLYRRSLVGDVPESDEEVRRIEPDFAMLHRLDRDAFDVTWRMDPLGLRESYKATSRSVVLGVGNDEGMAGYAIVGVSGITGYLQRIAVDPDEQGHGHGRRLVRASLRWAANHGAATMLLNTQPENDRSAALYRAEGFNRLPGDLEVLAIR